MHSHKVSSPPKTRKAKLSPLRIWSFRIAASTLVPTLFLTALNLLLFLVGFGYPTSFFLPTNIESEDVFIENIQFGRTFFPKGVERAPLPVKFHAEKSKDEYRIFVLGESAAMGFPNEAFSFARMLEVMLRDRYPETRFTVVNTSMTAINSHVILPIAKACSDHQPDLFVIYMGNNEIVGPYGVSGVLGAHVRQLELARASIWLKTTRTGQLLTQVAQSTLPSHDAPDSWQGMSMFVDSRLPANDPRLASTYDQFESNLRDICAVGRNGGASVIVSTVATNVRDCAPFASLPSSDMPVSSANELESLLKKGVRLESAERFADAITCYEAAIQIDDQRADLHFRVARCLLNIGHVSDAQHHYLLSRDRDVLRFRTDSRINEIIRSVAHNRAADGLFLVDAVAAFEKASQYQLPGNHLFFEHVHMTFAGNYLLARSIFQQVEELLPTWIQRQRIDSSEPLSEADCKRLLVYTDWSQFRSLVMLSELFKQPPFTAQAYGEDRELRLEQDIQALEKRLESGGYEDALSAYERSLKESGIDIPILSELGVLLMLRGDADAAIVKFSELKKKLPYHPAPRVMLAEAYAAQGRRFDAIAECDEALKLCPGWKQAVFMREKVQAALRGAH